MSILADSGELSDIQAAVNNAVAGESVILPEGIFDAIIDPNNIGPTKDPVGVVIPGGVSVIGQGKNKTILRVPYEPPYHSSIFILDGRNGLQSRISGIGFKNYVYLTENTMPSAIRIIGATDYRIDHCEFWNWTANGIDISNHWLPQGANRGVIDHCDFDAPYKGEDGTDIPTATALWCYGIQIRGTYYNWPDLDSLLGKYDGVENIVYIEDCTFNRMRHAVVANAGGFYVLRHSTMTGGIPRNFAQIDVHGSTGVDPAVGGRGFEAYGNEVIGGPYPEELGGGWRNYGVGQRGGGGVIYNNRFIDDKFPIHLTNDLGVYELTRLQDVYIWGNAFEKVNMDESAPVYPITIGDPDKIIEDRDFFLYKRQGYIPYPYPHPITLPKPSILLWLLAIPALLTLLKGKKKG